MCRFFEVDQCSLARSLVKLILDQFLGRLSLYLPESEHFNIFVLCR